MTTRKEEINMKKLLVTIALVMSVATLGRTANVTDTGPGTTGDVLYFTGQAGNDQGTWSNLPSLVQTIINNNTVVPATVGTSLNSSAVSTVGNVDITGSGITQTVTGSGATGTSSYNFNNLSTTEGQTNATNISNLSSTVGGNTTQINQNTSDISNIQNLSDNSLLTQTVNNHTSQISTLNSNVASINNMSDPTTVLNQTVNGNTAGISAINNMSDPSTVLNQTVNGNTTAIANETTRATGAETTLSNGLSNEAATRASADTTLQNNINNEATTRASADQALQNQINNVNAQAQDNTNRIDRLEQTKYLLEPTVRLYDDKHFQVQAFDSYDVRHSMNFAAGLRVMFKVGPSYEEKLLKKTNPEIARLLSANVNHDIVERDEIRKQLAEDRALIAEQSALLKQLSAKGDNVVLNASAPSKAEAKFVNGGDDDLLKAMEDRNEKFGK